MSLNDGITRPLDRKPQKINAAKCSLPARKRLTIAGCGGVPGRYGGFETLADNLVRIWQSSRSQAKLSVYCSRCLYDDSNPAYLGAELRWVPLAANGPLSPAFDTWCLLDAVRRGVDVILLLGVSGALALPLVRLLSPARIVTNIDGMEWRRAKWGRLARWFLRISEASAVRYSHVVIADNQVVGDYVYSTYGKRATVIAYGGDHALCGPSNRPLDRELPPRYALALCRIEPENSVHTILEAFATLCDEPLVFVGNWSNSEYGRTLRQRFGQHDRLYLWEPVYDSGHLRQIRGGAWLYVHGHSAGGTNPALVEMMHFGIPVAANGCAFNRETTANQAIYFETAPQLAAAVRAARGDIGKLVGARMRSLANERYTWAKVGLAYYDLLEG